ncbi:MAG TPA: hypothetical protein VEU62_14240 [Bryobacterales bacterium]|nr:hypothetical protein [Bryobacterales bacterium]
MNWQRLVQRVLTTGMILAGIYLAIVFIGRSREPKMERPKPAALPLSPDYYVVPPKSYVRGLADLKALLGKPLWVRAGYRWTCTPGSGTLGPLEKLVPVRAFARGGRTWLEFRRDGHPCAIPVATGDYFYLDEVFFIKDPHEIYKDWTAATWEKIERHRAEAGMTEHQISFALGAGELVRGLSGRGDAHRVVDYTGGETHARVIYEYGVAKQVEPLPAGP